MLGTVSRIYNEGLHRGGVLNYHGPFTSITSSMLREWDKRIRAVLRDKLGIKQGVRLGMLYDNTGKGLKWFSARSCVREVVLTEGGGEGNRG